MKGIINVGFDINGKVSEGLNAGKDVVTDEHVEKAEGVINEKLEGFGK